MLGRRHFRAKVLQGLYAYYQGGEPCLEKAEKNLLVSIEKITELYYLQLSFILEVADFYSRRTEDAKRKFYPTQEELNPNTKLIENTVIRILRENKDLSRRIRNYKFTWSDEQDNIRKVYQRIRESKEHKEYLSSEKSSFEEDKEFILKLLKKVILRAQELHFYCEDQSIHWIDDFDIAASFVLKTIRLITRELASGTPLPTLLHKGPEEDPEEERQFIVDLFRKTILHGEEFEHMIESRTKNWELDRIALTDIILLKMALAELIYFPTIPVKVTLNEYIELSKHFSTLKSKVFINGILDKLVSDLREKDGIQKAGRGLIN